MYAIMEYIFLVLWFLFLIKWADFLIDWAWSIAKSFGISSLVIWLTVVAFGTSAPEFVVSFMASLEGKTQMAISNVVGSNIVNVLFILWVTALIFPVKMPNSTIKKEIPFAILVSFLLLVLMSDVALGTGLTNSMWVIDGIILLIFFAGFLYYTYTISKDGWNDDEEEIKEMAKWKSALYIIIGLAGLIYGWQLIVNNAVIIAKSLGMSDAFIGLTIIAIGTSLPELASSIMAALKKKTDMAIGAIVGSNIFNILWILGFSAAFAQLDGYKGIEVDLIVMIFAVVLLLIFAFTPKKNILWRFDGAVLVWVYVAYIGYLLTTL